MKCPVCRNRKCKWIDLTDKQIKRADTEERMYSMLEPLEDELKIKLRKGKT